MVPHPTITAGATLDRNNVTALVTDLDRALRGRPRRVYVDLEAVESFASRTLRGPRASTHMWQETMQLTSKHGWLAAALFLAMPAMAQAELGAMVAAPHWQQWLRGDAIEFAQPMPDDAPPCTVWAFYSQLPHLLSADGDYLSQVQARYAERGVRVVAVVKGEHADGLDRLLGCSVVVDDAARTEMAWAVANATSRTNSVVLNHDGTIAFLGRPGAGLVDAIDDVLAGEQDLVLAGRARGTRLLLPGMFDDATGKETVELLQPLVKFAPRDGLLNGLLYLTLATKANDEPAARKHLQAAVQQLRAEARPLAVFADLVLRGDARRTTVVAMLRPALKQAAAAAKADPVVQLAYLRVLIMAGDGREAGRQAMRIRKGVTETGAGCLDYATLLARDENPQIHADLATLTLNKAEKLGADPRLLAAARYIVALRCAGDELAAKRIMTVYLNDPDMRVGLNNDSWYFMTSLPTMGRFDWFAVGLVERMLDERESMDYFELDTAALAMFLVGRVTAAVSLQEEALKNAGKASPGYRERLVRYQAHLTAAPR